MGCPHVRKKWAFFMSQYRTAMVIFWVKIHSTRLQWFGQDSQFKTVIFSVGRGGLTLDRKRGAYKNNHLIKTFHVTFPIIWRLSELVTSKYTFYGFSIDP